MPVGDIQELKIITGKVNFLRDSEVSDEGVKKLLNTYKLCEGAARDYTQDQKLLLAYVGAWIWKFHELEQEMLIGNTPIANNIRKRMSYFVKHVADIYSSIHEDISDPYLVELTLKLHDLWTARIDLEPTVSKYDTEEIDPAIVSLYLFSPEEEERIEGYRNHFTNVLLNRLYSKLNEIPKNDAINKGILKRMILWLGDYETDRDIKELRLAVERITGLMRNPEIKDDIDYDVGELMKSFRKFSTILLPLST